MELHPRKPQAERIALENVECRPEQGFAQFRRIATVPELRKALVRPTRYTPDDEEPISCPKTANSD
jgi:hypothetical protein